MKHLAFIIILAFVFVFLISLNSVSADLPTYTVKLTPSFDTWIDLSTMSWHNDSTTLDFEGSCCGSADKWRNRIAVEWNTSSIPDGSAITNVSINFTYTTLWIDYNSYMYVHQFSNQPTKSNATTVWDDAKDGGRLDWYKGYSRRGTSTATGYYEFNTTGDGDNDFQKWSYDPCQDLQDNLTADWFAVGIIGRSAYDFRTAEGSIASLENTSTDPMYLWVEYYYNGPYVSNESPSNEATGVALQPNTCIDLEHPSGTNMDIEWQWLDGAVWKTYGTNSSVTNGTYCQSFTNASVINTTYYWRVRVNDSFGNWTNMSYSFTTYDYFDIDFNWTIVEQNYTEYGFTYHIVNFSDITNVTSLTIDNWIWDLGNGEVISGIFPYFKNVSTRYEQKWNTSLYNESAREINVTLTLCNFTSDYEASVTKQISLPRINPSTDYIDFSWMNLLPVIAVIILILLLVAVVIKLVGGVI